MPFLFIGCGVDVQKATLPSSDNVYLRAFFSYNDGDSSRYGIDDRMIEDISNATESIKVAIYNLTSDEIRDALIDAYSAGVDVSVYTDDSNKDDEDIIMLKNSGIPVYDDHNKYALMHDKFMVIDNKIVWSGSTNYTEQSFYKNYENAVRIVDHGVANFYAQEFLEMISDTLIPKPYISPKLEIYFSPEDNFRERLLTLINKATTSIHFMIYSFTNKEIADALINAQDRGVEVEGVFDKSWSSNRYSKDEYLEDAGIDIKYDGNPYTLHDKVMIIDDEIVVTGSYNFTNSANDKNEENSLIIKDISIANKYENEFDKIYLEAE